MNNMELRLAGSGGQGIILATVILAEAAVLAGMHAAQSQSYGPEARGGSCKAEVLISRDPIGYTKVRKPTLLLVLTQQALDQYANPLPEGCTLVADSSLTVPDSVNPSQVVSLPILQTAREKVGKIMTANIIAVSCINTLLKLVPKEQLYEAVMRHIPKGTEALNIAALEAGESLIPSAPDSPKKQKAGIPS